MIVKIDEPSLLCAYLEQTGGEFYARATRNFLFVAQLIAASFSPQATYHLTIYFLHDF